MEDMQLEGVNTPTDIHYVCFILDGRVEMTLGTDARFAAILLSDPIIRDIRQGEFVNIGDIYDEETDTIYRPTTPDDVSELTVEPNA
jgi:hypothetical protein